MAHAAEHKLDREAQTARDLLAAIAPEAEGDEDLVQDMVEGETGLLEAIERALAEIRECEVTKDGCAAEIERLTKRKQRAEARADKIRAAIEQAMMTSGMEKIKLATRTLSLSRRAPKVQVIDEALVPSAYFVQPPPKLDKTALAKALKEGPVKGAVLGNPIYSLTIRSA